MMDKITNTDGSVYMTFPPTTPRIEPERYTVRHVWSSDNPPSDLYDTGSHGGTVTARTHFRGVLEARTELTRAYQVRYVSHGHGVTSDGRPWYRYSWERLTSWGGRVSDTLWIVRDAS